MPSHWKQFKPGSAAYKQAKEEHKALEEYAGSKRKARRTSRRGKRRLYT